jgi:hypothetical protein
MNTIQVTTVDGPVNYTEAEVVRYIEKAGQVDRLNQNLKDLRYQVRDFFSEGGWEDGEWTINKDDVNTLLVNIGCDKLTSRYSGNFTVTGTFTIEVDDEDDIESIIADNLSVDCYNTSDFSVDQVDVTGIRLED